jgi:hypothetical protein
MRKGVVFFFLFFFGLGVGVSLGDLLLVLASWDEVLSLAVIGIGAGGLCLRWKRKSAAQRARRRLRLSV